MQGAYAQLSDYISQTRTLIHDQSASDFTDAQLTPIINNARFRVALDCRCVRQFIAGLNTISQQEAYPLTGFVGGVVVNNGGHGFSANTTASFSGGGGTGAAAQVIVVNGVITNIQMTNWGGGYATAPTLTLNNTGGGTGASYSVIAGTNILDIYTMTVLWNGPPSALAVTFDWLPFGAFQAFCRAYRGTFSNPGAWTAHYGPISPTSPQANAQSFYIYPIPNQVYPLEMDVITTSTPLVNDSDVDYQIITPWSDAVQYFSAHLCFLSLQQYAQSGVMKSLYDGRLKELPATAFARRVHNFYRLFGRTVRRM